MKTLRVIYLILFSLIASSHGEPEKTASDKANVVTGYPIYKFVNFESIDKKALEGQPKEVRKLLGAGYGAYLKYHHAMVAAGFDQHQILRLIVEGQKENVEVFIPNKNFKELWITSPYDLFEQGKSHLVTIEYESVLVEGRKINRATSFHAELVDHKPTIMK